MAPLIGDRNYRRKILPHFHSAAKFFNKFLGILIRVFGEQLADPVKISILFEIVISYYKAAVAAYDMRISERAVHIQRQYLVYVRGGDPRNDRYAFLAVFKRIFGGYSHHNYLILGVRMSNGDFFFSVAQ